MMMIISNEDKAEMLHVTGKEARTLKVLLSPELHPGLEEIAAGYSIIPPGSRSDRIAHVEGEMFYVCDGRGKILIGDETSELFPTVTAWAPPNIVHQLINDGRETLKILWVLCPPGREKPIIEKSRAQ